MIKLLNRKPFLAPVFPEKIWWNLMTKETATGKKLNRKKKRVLRALLP